MYQFKPDPVVEAYKRHIDQTLLRENLRRSVDERVCSAMSSPERRPTPMLSNPTWHHGFDTWLVTKPILGNLGTVDSVPVQSAHPCRAG